MSSKLIFKKKNERATLQITGSRQDFGEFIDPKLAAYQPHPVVIGHISKTNFAFVISTSHNHRYAKFGNFFNLFSTTGVVKVQ